ncbi:MAG: hypothetical protein SV375_19120 [Thermodesulfobacteriota bacterium]|nr:hypothetical protein [Thermodesulfobacteriota bacterium]
MQLNLDDKKQVKEFIISELPKIMEKDPAFQQNIFRLSSGLFAEKKETENRFDKLLDELREDRERQDKKWDAQEKKWWDNQKKQDEMLEEIRMLSRKHDSTIGALGARCGGPSY